MLQPHHSLCLHLLNHQYRWYSQPYMTVCVLSSSLTYVQVDHCDQRYLGWWKRLSWCRMMKLATEEMGTKWWLGDGWVTRKDHQKFSSHVAEVGAGSYALANVVLYSKSFWMVSCSTEIFLPGSNNHTFAFGVVTLFAGFEMMGFNQSRN